MNRVLLKYICNEANEAEAFLVKSRISSDPKNREYYQKLKDIYNNKDLAETAFRKEKSWDVVKNKAFASSFSKTKKKIVLTPLLVKLAASVSLFISFGFAGKDVLYKQQSNRWIELIAGTGGIKQVTLPEGTVVWLNSQSKLKYPKRFKKDKRVVELTGEAYFEISHNPSHPFIVKTKKLQVHVLGKSFIVTSYANDELIKTTLVDGKVAVLTGHNQIELGPSQQFFLSKTSDEHTLEYMETESLAKWIDGLITFDNEPFKDIASKLERYYGVQIFYIDEIGEKAFTGSFDRNESLEFMLKLFQLAEPIIYKIIGNTVYITKDIFAQTNL